MSPGTTRNDHRSRTTLALIGIVLAATGCTGEAEAQPRSVDSITIAAEGIGPCSITGEINDQGTRSFVTAAHCIGENNHIESVDGEYRMEVIAVFEDYDLAVLRAPQGLLLPSYETASLPEPSTLVCKYGQRVERDCGTFIGSAEIEGRTVFLADICSVPGDSGSVVVWDGRLIGVESGDVSNAPTVGTHAPCNSLQQQVTNPLYTLGLPDQLLD